MQETTSDAGEEEEIYTAHFGGLFSLKGNPDLKGPGKIIVNPSLKKVVFKAHRRAFFSNRPMEVSFGAADIDNVVLHGNSVRFDTLKGRAGRNRTPFIFWLKDRAQASAMAAILAWDAPSDSVAPFSYVGRPPRAWRTDYKSATTVLVALNLVVFVAMAAFTTAGWSTAGDSAPYIKYGANNGPLTSQGEWWRLVASLFLHFGLLHLLFNLCALVPIGQALERATGRALFLLAYFATGIAGGLTSILVHGGNTWSAGASGAIFGLYGVFIGMILRERQLTPDTRVKPLTATALLFLGYNVLYGMRDPTVDLAAHCGGLASGFILGLFIAAPLEPGEGARFLKKTFIPCAIAATLMIGVEAGLVRHFGYDVWAQYLFEKTVGDFQAEEKDNLQAYHATQTSPVTDEGNRKVERAAAQLNRFYDQWIAAMAAVTSTSPRILERKNELQASIDQEKAVIRREAARRSEIVALRDISVQVETQLKAVTEARDSNQSSPTFKSEAQNYLRQLRQQVDGFETTSDETRAAKAEVLKRIDAVQSSIATVELPIVDEIHLAELKTLEEKYHRGLDECVKRIPHEETSEAIDRTIAVIGQELIPFLRECEGSIERVATAEDTSRQKRSSLLAEVSTNRQRAERLVSQLTEKRTARRLQELADAFNQNNQIFANRASLVGRDPKQDAADRIALIKNEVFPYLTDTLEKIRAERAQAPKLQDAYDQLLSEIAQKQTKWTDILQDYEHVLSFLTAADQREAEWKTRYDKLNELTKKKGGELAAQKYIVTELIPFNERSIEQLDQIDRLNASGPVEDLRVSTRENLKKRSSALRDMAVRLSAPKKR